jgi:transposase
VEHIGIDLGSRHSHVVVLSPTGQQTAKYELVTEELPGWLSRRQPSHVVMEACTQSAAVARAALAAGHLTKVVPGQLVRLLGVGARGIKTDDKDAQALARASLRNEDLPSVHLRSEQSRSRRELLAARATLLEARKSIVLSVKSWLRGRLIVLKGRASAKSFGQTVRNTAVKHPDGLPMAIETLLVTFEHLCDQLEKLDEQVHALAESDATCERLMVIPGVGPHVSLAFTTHLDDPKRFASADKLASYLALVPGENTTGGKLKRTSTIHAGPGYLKALLVQSAWSMYRSRPNDPIVLWTRAIADKRGKRIAIIALARKLATIMWSMWRHSTSYNPARASSVRKPETAPALAATQH